MDKQIIIDEIDVSGCRYLFDDTSYKRSKTSCSITLKDCKYLGDNCYYKQLKRKEQECELWKTRYEELKKQSGRLEAHLATLEAKIEVDKAQYKELKAENEELKRQHRNQMEKL